MLYSPHQGQLKIHQSRSRFRVASWGRQAGKTTCALNELVDRAWRTPGTKYWFLSPSYDQATDVFRRLIGMLASCWGVIIQQSVSELRIKFINQSEITFKSGEVLERLRGPALHGVVIDEVRDQRPGLWSRVVQPMLRTTNGWALFISTPNGFDHFYELYQKGETNQRDWQSFQAPSVCNPLFTKDEYESAQREMSEAEFAQEILAQFRNLTTGMVYVNHGEWNWKRESPFTRDGERVSPHLPIVLGCDFNLNPMSWHLGQHNNGVTWWYDRIILKNSHTQEATKELIHRVKGHMPGLLIIGDATAKAGQRAAAGKSDYAIIEYMLDEAEIPYENRTPDSNPTQKDRANVMNSAMKAADGTVRFFYDPVTCPELKMDCERVVWKEGAQAVMDKSDPSRTHASDSVGYPTCVLMGMWEPSPGVARIIVR